MHWCLVGLRPWKLIWRLKLNLCHHYDVDCRKGVAYKSGMTNMSKMHFHILVTYFPQIIFTWKIKTQFLWIYVSVLSNSKSIKTDHKSLLFHHFKEKTLTVELLLWIFFCVCIFMLWNDLNFVECYVYNGYYIYEHEKQMSKQWILVPYQTIFYSYNKKQKNNESQPISNFMPHIKS